MKSTLYLQGGYKKGTRKFKKQDNRVLEKYQKVERSENKMPIEVECSFLLLWSIEILP